jgi:uncharacterized protein (DUF952 family)
MIYHVTTESQWSMQMDSTSFQTESLQLEGFIHCCKLNQLNGVLQRYFNGKSNLVLLTIDERKLKAELKYESGTEDDLFPHIYGAIERAAIIKWERIK